MNDSVSQQQPTSQRGRWFELLDGSLEASSVGRVLNLFMVLLIALNVIMVVLESVAVIQQHFARSFRLFEIFSVVVFSLR